MQNLSAPQFRRTTPPYATAQVRSDAEGRLWLELREPGENTLELKVVNLWINRLIGDEQLPEDSDRHSNGTLKARPQWVNEAKPSPTGRYTFYSITTVI